ncbi:MAG: hypothetical protein K9K38_20260, partial [Rhodoferax sp.]|nr:hypothetical protein [Rhodoferax sp.]
MHLKPSVQSLLERGWFHSVGAIAVCAAILLAACAPAQKVSERTQSGPPVYPAPPDEARFVFERSIHGSADVVPEAEESALKRALTGGSASSEG